MRTFDSTRVPEDLLNHTTWTDLLAETPYEHSTKISEEEEEYVIERVVRKRRRSPRE